MQKYWKFMAHAGNRSGWSGVAGVARYLMYLLYGGNADKPGYQHPFWKTVGLDTDRYYGSLPDGRGFMNVLWYYPDAAAHDAMRKEWSQEVAQMRHGSATTRGAERSTARATE